MELTASFMCSYPAKLVDYNRLLFTLDLSGLDPWHLGDGGRWYFAINSFSDLLSWGRVSRRRPLPVKSEYRSLLPKTYTFLTNKSYERQDRAEASRQWRAQQFFTVSQMQNAGAVVFQGADRVFYKIDDLAETRELQIKVVGVDGQDQQCEIKTEKILESDGLSPWQYMSLNICILRLD